MYCVITKPEIELPTVISTQDKHFCDFILAGYEIIHEGTKKDCLKVEEEMIKDFIY